MHFEGICGLNQEHNYPFKCKAVCKKGAMGKVNLLFSTFFCGGGGSCECTAFNCLLFEWYFIRLFIDGLEDN